MIVPKPPMELEGHCSVVHENTLYVYAASGFASIPLQHNAPWSTLKVIESVSGAVCVKAAMNAKNDEEALYVIGGTGSSEQYTGFQRYSFRNKHWEILSPGSTDSPVTRNRTGHSVVYLESSSLILMYAGSQGESQVPSSDTFTIGTSPPYTVLGYSTTKAPPAISPALLPWSNSEAALLDGLTNQSVHIFHSGPPAVDPWSEPIMSLAKAFPAGEKYALLKRSDGSKILEAFDMTASPNNVTSVVLADPTRQNNVTNSSASIKNAGDSNFDNYSAYNGRFAPMKVWENYSLAHSDDNLVVISGGSGTDSLAIFNQTSNSWLNTTKLFYGDKTKQQILRGKNSPQSNRTSAPSGTTAAVNNSNVGTIVGSVLGGLAGVIIILALILLLLRWSGKKRAARDGSSDANRLSFQDRAEEPFAQSAYPMAKSQVPYINSPPGTLTIFPGKTGNEKLSQHLGLDAAYGQKPMLTVQPVPAGDDHFKARESGQAGDRRTDEGWSRYFVNNNSAVDLARQSDRSLSGSDFGSPEPKENAWPMTSLAPLNFGFLDEPRPLGRVVCISPTERSPTGEDGKELVIPEGQLARISNADSLSTISGELDAHEGHVTRASQCSWLGRPPSSTYSNSLHYSGPQEAASKGVQSSVAISGSIEERRPAGNANTDMSWLNLNGER